MFLLNIIFCCGGYSIILINVKKTLVEVVWVKFNLKGNGTVYSGSYNRRHVSDGESMEQLETSLHRASSIRNASGGDFNLPGWEWRSTTLKPNATYPNLHQQFLDINNNGLAQIVEDSTRLDNTRLDSH